MSSDAHYLHQELLDLMQKDSSLFTFLQAGSLDGIWYWDLENTANEWMSPEFWTTLGYDPREKKHLASEWQDLIHPDDLRISLDNFEKHCADPNHPYDQIARYRHKDGSTVWVRCRGIAIRDKSGKPIRMLGAHNDLTEQKRVEKELRESEQKWRNILVNTPQIGISLDPKARITFANARFLQLTGWEEQKVIGQDWFDLFIPETIKEEIRNVFTTTMTRKETGALSSYENDILTKTGELRRVAWSNVLTKDSTGNIIDVTCLGIDLTERTRAEEELRRSEEQYRLLVENQTDLVVKLDPEGRFLFVSPSYCRMFGKKAAELLGQKFMPLVHEEDQEPTAKAMEALFSPPYTAYMEQRAMTKDGWRWLAWSDTAVLDRAGRVKEIVAVGRDISGRKQAERQRDKLQAQLNQAQKMEAIGTLAGGIAHDFNNILSAVLGFTELALNESHKGTFLHDNLTEVETAGNRAKELVKQILAISRHDKQSQLPLEINPLVKEALKMLRSTLPSSIEMQENLSADPLVVQVDPTQLHQVVINLATNAKQAMPDQEGILEVSLDAVGFDDSVKNRYPNLKPGRYARITVSDTGSGIPEHDLEKIFEPYFTTKEKGTGTGLGLSVVHGIVKSHQGHITVYSEPGKGSTFLVYLPLARQKASAAPVEGGDESLPKGMERILLIDDEEIVVKIQKQFLERLGYSVTGLTNSQEALDLFRASPQAFDLVITDMTMPKMTGDRLARALKEIRPGIPVILCTGFSEKINGQGENLDIDGFMMKPVDQAKLAGLMRKVLDSGRSHQTL